MPGDYTGLLALLLFSFVFAVLVIGVGALLGGGDDTTRAPAAPPERAPAALDARLRLVRIGLLFTCVVPALSIVLLWLAEARVLGSAAVHGVLGLGLPVLVGVGAAVARGALRW